MQNKRHYGAIYDTFWTGTTGQLIQRLGGVNATLLALFLMSNRRATALGLYELPAAVMLAETPIGPTALPPALVALAEAEFAVYDAASAVAWVYSMVGVRLNLTPERPALPAEDHKVAMVNRLYESIVDNPYLGAFYDRHHEALHLKRLRSCNQIPKQLWFSDEFAPKQRSGTTGRTTDKITGAARRPVEKSVENVPTWVQPEFASFKLYAVIAREAIIKASLESDETIANVSEHFKRLCARRRIPYTGDIVSTAISAAMGGGRR